MNTVDVSCFEISLSVYTATISNEIQIACACGVFLIRTLFFLCISITEQLQIMGNDVSLPSPHKSFFELEATNISGEKVHFSQYEKNKAIVVVNVAR
jgi:hypothetical protein